MVDPLIHRGSEVPGPPLEWAWIMDRSSIPLPPVPPPTPVPRCTHRKFRKPPKNPQNARDEGMESTHKCFYKKNVHSTTEVVVWHANTKQKTIHRCFLVILIFPTFVQCAVYVATTRQDYKTTCLLTTLSMVVDRTVDCMMDRGWAVVKKPPPCCMLHGSIGMCHLLLCCCTFSQEKCVDRFSPCQLVKLCLPYD